MGILRNLRDEITSGETMLNWLRNTKRILALEDENAALKAENAELKKQIDRLDRYINKLDDGALNAFHIDPRDK